MPQLDVSFMVSDPMLADGFSVIRRREAMGANGRPSVEEENYPDLIGVVTQQDPADLMRRDDGQFVPRSIFVASTFAFRNATDGWQPDIIVWGGEEYHVKQAFPYSKFGAGIHEAVASTMQSMDQPV